MKTNKIISVALMALVLVGCGKKGADKFKDVKLDKNATATDTIGYYMGEYLANVRTQMAENDTVLKSDDAKAKFDEGFYCGLEALSGDDQAFNRGFISGVMAAAEIMMKAEAADEKIQMDAFASGYANSFDKNGKPVKDLDKRVNEHRYVLMAKLQQLEGRIMNKQIEDALKKTDAAKKNVEATAKKEGYSKMGNYYVKTVDKGTGTKLTKGENVIATIGIRDVAGNVVMPQGQISQVIGEPTNFFPPIDALQLNMDLGGKYYIIGTIDQLVTKDMAAQKILSNEVDPSTLFVLEYVTAPASE